MRKATDRWSFIYGDRITLRKRPYHDNLSLPKSWVIGGEKGEKGEKGESSE